MYRHLPSILAVLLLAASPRTNAAVAADHSASSSAEPCDSKAAPGTRTIAVLPQNDVIPRMDAYRSVQERPDQQADLALAVAISGGGYRAANFATGVLKQLETIPTGPARTALDEIDYFSTVSGGGLAAATYISTRHRHQQHERAGEFSFIAALGKHGPLARSLRKNLQTQLYWAIPFRYGRNERLHDQLLPLVQVDEKQAITLGDLFIPRCTEAPGKACDQEASRKPHLPYWIANATVLQTGAIFPITPDLLEAYRVVGYRHRDNKCHSPYAMPVSVGLTASATFPALIPPLTLCRERPCTKRSHPSSPVLQLIDGGDADNLGVLTALNVLAQDDAPRKVLLVIDAYVNERPTAYDYTRSSSWGVFLKQLLHIPLTSWHGRYEELIRTMAAGLAKPTERWCIIILRLEDLQASDQDLAKVLVGVGTRFTLTEEQQAELWDAGMTAVSSWRHVIEDALKGVPTTYPSLPPSLKRDTGPR